MTLAAKQRNLGWWAVKLMETYNSRFTKRGRAPLNSGGCGSASVSFPQ